MVCFAVPGPDDWQVAQQAPPLLQGHAHVWRFSLDRLPEELDRWTEVLSPDERQRAARFAMPQLRQRFTAGRGLLRTILSGYLGITPVEIEFSYNGYGKPDLCGSALGKGLSFNLSHTAGLALLGVCLGRRIGVDVEAIRDNVKCEQLAERFFSAQEAAELLALPDADRRAAFFRCWTRKESYIKALGRGLSMPLESFDVSLHPSQPARLVAVRDDPGEVDRWHVVALTPAAGYEAAMFVERPIHASWFGAWPEIVGSYCRNGG
jgi:4'-phosphopantetheinyl transferase